MGADCRCGPHRSRRAFAAPLEGEPRGTSTLASPEPASVSGGHHHRAVRSGRGVWPAHSGMGIVVTIALLLHSRCQASKTCRQRAPAIHECWIEADLIRQGGVLGRSGSRPPRARPLRRGRIIMPRRDIPTARQQPWGLPGIPCRSPATDVSEALRPAAGFLARPLMSDRTRGPRRGGRPCGGTPIRSLRLVP